MYLLYLALSKKGNRGQNIENKPNDYTKKLKIYFDTKHLQHQTPQHKGIFKVGDELF